MFLILHVSQLVFVCLSTVCLFLIAPVVLSQPGRAAVVCMVAAVHCVMFRLAQILQERTTELQEATDALSGMSGEFTKLEHALAAAEDEAALALIVPHQSCTEPDEAVEGNAEMQTQLVDMKYQLNRATLAIEVMRRKMALTMVYHQFDLDGNGSVGEEELLELGQARRRLGQKQGEWTMENTRQLMEKMGTDTNGECCFMCVSDAATTCNEGEL